MTSTQQNLRTFLIACAFGFALNHIGFSSWDAVFGMFALTNLRLTLSFGVAFAALAVAWPLIHKKTGATWSPRNIHKGTMIGAVLFGAGWALCGACPSGACVALGELQWGALFTVIGIAIGNTAYAFIHEKYLRFPQQSCVDD